MNKLFFILSISVVCITAYSQAPTITISQASSFGGTISCGANTCFIVDPIEEITYSVNVASNGQYTSANGWTRSLPTWVATPGTFTNDSGNGTTDYQLSWNNAPNTSSRTIKVTFTYTKPGQSPQTFSKEQGVIIKYIGGITSITIPGATPSNPSNLGTASAPCGTGSFTITVPAVATDPAVGVTYDWDLPSGWSGSSTSNSITVTPDAGQNDGWLSVGATRNDNGGLTETYHVYVTRPRVNNAIITSVSWSPDDKPLCNSETRQLSGASTVSASIYNWSTTGGISITGASNQSTVTVSGTSNGTLTLVASNACGVSSDRTWDIYANTPQVGSSEVSVDGHPNYYPNYTSGSSYINVQGGGSCQSYKWELYGGSGSFSPGYCSCGYAYNGITFDHCSSGSASTSSSMAIRLRTANRCGQGNDVIIPLEISGGGGYYRMSSPNPATTTITIELDKAKASSLNVLNIVSATRSKIARSFDVAAAKSSNYFKTNNIVSFDVSNLERGLYYVVLNFGENNQSFSELVMLH